MRRGAAIATVSWGFVGGAIRFLQPRVSLETGSCHEVVLHLANLASDPGLSAPAEGELRAGNNY